MSSMLPIIATMEEGYMALPFPAVSPNVSEVKQYFSGNQASSKNQNQSHFDVVLLQTAEYISKKRYKDPLRVCFRR